MRNPKNDLLRCSKCSEDFPRNEYGCVRHMLTCAYPLPAPANQVCVSCNWHISNGLCSPTCESPQMTEQLGTHKVLSALEHLLDSSESQLMTPAMDHSIAILSMAHDALTGEYSHPRWLMN